jgi:RNA recognition motif-containing protein
LNFNVEKKNPNSFCFFSGKLIVRNIPFKTKINNLKKIFSIFGKILSIRLPKKKNGENRGFAFIKYNNLNDAKKALFFVQNTKIDSRSLRVNLIK